MTWASLSSELFLSNIILEQYRITEGNSGKILWTDWCTLHVFSAAYKFLNNFCDKTDVWSVSQWMRERAFFRHVSFLSIFIFGFIVCSSQCMRRLADESKADEIMVISFWRHEMNRIVRDRISRTSDLNWFDDKLEAVIEAVSFFTKRKDEMCAYIRADRQTDRDRMRYNMPWDHL